MHHEVYIFSLLVFLGSLYLDLWFSWSFPVMFRTITFHGHQDAGAVTSKDVHKFLSWDILGDFETEWFEFINQE